jgi:hypothetical protein
VNKEVGLGSEHSVQQPRPPHGSVTSLEFVMLERRIRRPGNCYRAVSHLVRICNTVIFFIKIEAKKTRGEHLCGKVIARAADSTSDKGTQNYRHKQYKVADFAGMFVNAPITKMFCCKLRVDLNKHADDA